MMLLDEGGLLCMPPLGLGFSELAGDERNVLGLVAACLMGGCLAWVIDFFDFVSCI